MQMNNATQSEPPPAELPLNGRLAQAAEAVARLEISEISAPTGGFGSGATR